MMKTMMTFVIGLALSGFLSAQQEAIKPVPACCAQGSSRAAMMARPAEVGVSKKEKQTGQGKAHGDKKVSQTKCSNCQESKKCAKCDHKGKGKGKGKKAVQKTISKKSDVQKKFPLDPEKIDLREIKKYLSR